MPTVPYTTRFRQQLDRLLDLRGRSPELSVLDDVMPVIELVDMADPEYHRLRGEDIGLGAGNVVGAIGQTPQVTLWNRSAARIVVLENFTVSHNAAGNLLFSVVVGENTVVGATAGVAARGDTRGAVGFLATVPLLPGGTVNTSSAVGGPGGSLVWQGFVQPGAVVLLPISGVILRPGWALSAFVTTALGVATSVAGSASWRERECELQELL